MERLRSVIRRFSLRGLVNVHHILPKTHGTLLPKGMLNDKPNLLLMPTRAGMENMNLRPERLVHQGGHLRYNAYVGNLLRDIVLANATSDALVYAAVVALQIELRRRIRSDDATLPWN
jgi:hypothetical protein